MGIYTSLIIAIIKQLKSADPDLKATGVHKGTHTFWLAVYRTLQPCILMDS